MASVLWKLHIIQVILCWEKNKLWEANCEAQEMYRLTECFNTKCENVFIPRLYCSQGQLQKYLQTVDNTEHTHTL